MSPPIAQGVIQVLDAIQAVLEDELAPYLSAWQTATGVVAPAPKYYWRGDVIPERFETPGVGLTVASTDYADYAAEGRWRVVHNVNAYIMLRDGDVAGAGLLDESHIETALQQLAQAITQAVETHLPAPGYGRPVGVIDCMPASAATAVVESEERGVYMRAVQVTFLIHQVVLGRVGVR